MKLSILGRSLVGAILGAWVGFTYGIVSSNVNIVVIRDIPIHYQFSDTINITGWALLVAAALGFLVNIWHDALKGVTIASLVSALGVTINGIIDSSGSTERLLSTLFLLAYVFLPLIVLLMPFNALLRWSNQQILSQENWLTSWDWSRLRIVLICTFLAALVGSFSLYSDSARQMMRRMNNLIQIAQSGGDQLPHELIGYKTAIHNASKDYTIEWSDDLRVYPESIFFEDTTTALRLNVVSVHFKSGQSLYCLLREVDRNLYLCIMLDKRPYMEYRTMVPSAFMWFPNQFFLFFDKILQSRTARHP